METPSTAPRTIAKYSNPRYDLWKGGRPKLITYRPFRWPQLWGKDWAVETELNPEFTED